MDSIATKDSNSRDSSSEKTSSRVGRERKRGSKVIPKGVTLLPDIPDSDYFSDVRGVYYHFKKMEWRTICKDPFNNSKRWQKTFGINKYGFYLAKEKAEMKAIETREKNHLYKSLGPNAAGLLSDDSNSQTMYFQPVTGPFPKVDLYNQTLVPHFNYSPPHFNYSPGTFNPLDKVNADPNLYFMSNLKNGSFYSPNLSNASPIRSYPYPSFNFSSNSVNHFYTGEQLQPL